MVVVIVVECLQWKGFVKQPGRKPVFSLKAATFSSFLFSCSVLHGLLYCQAGLARFRLGLPPVPIFSPYVLRRGTTLVGCLSRFSGVRNLSFA